MNNYINKYIKYKKKYLKDKYNLKGGFKLYDNKNPEYIYPKFITYLKKKVYKDPTHFKDKTDSVVYYKTLFKHINNYFNIESQQKFDKIVKFISYNTKDIKKYQIYYKNSEDKLKKYDKKNKRDSRNVVKLFYFLSKKPKAIIHLSAKKSIPESMKSPFSYYFNNTLSKFFIGICSRLFNIPVIFASSAAIYNPYNPYAKSKLAEEKFLKFICKKVAI